MKLFFQKDKYKVYNKLKELENSKDTEEAFTAKYLLGQGAPNVIGYAINLLPIDFKVLEKHLDFNTLE